ncbi:MAG: hypothetical protein PUG48_11790 [Clostridia bacterium]|nr:hypothetical protein [Clostridia bacterium]
MIFEKYEQAEMEIIEFDTEDMITASKCKCEGAIELPIIPVK